MVINGVIIGVHDRFLVETKRVQQRRHRQFAATVNAAEHQILGIEFEIQPRPTVRNDTTCEQQLTRAVCFTFVVIKEHARRTVHLGYDNTLCAVYDECAVWRHQWHIAHKDVLLFDVFHRLRACIFIDIKHDQTKRNLKRRGIGHVALLTFFYVILGLFELIFNEFQNGCFVEILNREDRLENTINPFAIKRRVTVARAQEKIVGRFLNLNKVRHIEDFANFTVIFAETFLAEETLRHVSRHLSNSHGQRTQSGPAPQPYETAIEKGPFLLRVPMHSARPFPA